MVVMMIIYIGIVIEMMLLMDFKFDKLFGLLEAALKKVTWDDY